MSKQKSTLPRTTPQPQPAKRTMWPLYLALVALAIIGIGALTLIRKPAASSVPAPASAAGPQLAVDQEKIDFGDVKVNKMVEAAFTISNTGTEPLQIIGQPKVRVAAGC
jgi:hypothetical protein